VTVEGGRRSTVELEAPPPTEEELAEAELDTRRDPLPPAAPGGGGVETEWWFWTLIGVVVVGAGVGIGLGVHLSSQPPEPNLRGDDDRTHLTIVEWSP
jgi:hypothetical protein